MNRFIRLLPARLLRLALLGLGLAGLGWAAPAGAAIRTDLFQATAPLTDRSESAQTAAFQAALRTVLVRVTGRRGAAEDPALAPLVGEARRFVQQYRTAADHELWVAFDPAAVERWLAQNSQPVWGRERPTTFVWLAVPTGPQTGTVITQGDPAELKAQLDAAAAARGITLLWPSAADLQNNRLDFAAVNAGPAATLAALGRRLGADGVLIGRANGPGGGMRWIHVFQDRSSESSGPLEGVDRAADTYAALFATSGSFAPIDIEVTGIETVREYAAALNYLESLAFISRLHVVALTGDLVRLRLTTRGGPEPLRRALALNGLLEPDAAADGGVQRFHLRR